jgi:chromosome transmission fidelity protein 4
MDKEFIQLIQAACKADNVPRAVELTKLLHHTVSFDMAKKVAAFYHLVGLQEKIDALKARREEEEEERLALARDKRRQWLVPDPLPRPLPAVTSRPADRLQDFGPPPAIYRPGLVRATPMVEKAQFSADASGTLGSVTDADADWVSPEGKRKRTGGDELEAEPDDHSKRRAVVVDDSPASTPKPSAFFFSLVHCRTMPQFLTPFITSRAEPVREESGRK